jgi:hypothetical protein
MPRHGGWRRTIATGPVVPTWQPLLRHWQWRCMFHSRATANGAVKKGYSDEIFSSMVYYLNSFQIWVIFV